MAFCLNCGAKIEEGAKFCFACGKAVIVVPSEPITPKAETYMHCSNCGEKLDRGTIFCSRCGTKQNESRSTKTFCSKCGAEIAEGINFCSKCGNAVNPAAVNSTAVNSPSMGAADTTEDVVITTDRKRHGFITFWLIASLISELILEFICRISPEFASEFLGMSVRTFVDGIITIANIYGYGLLLSWKKLGFWVIICSSVFSLIANVVSGESIGIALIGLVGIPILWGILQLRKDGKSTWEQLV